MGKHSCNFMEAPGFGAGQFFAGNDLPPANGNGAGRKKILIVEAHPVMRAGLCAVINSESDMFVCAQAATACQAMSIIRTQSLDLILTGISLPGKSGLELIKDIQTIYPGLAILVLSVHEESLYAERVLHAGARGYISKYESASKLVAAIRQVLANHMYLSKEESERLLLRFSGKSPAKQSPMDALTDREFEIFQKIGEGKPPKEIAFQLHLSIRTVAVHYANIRQKLNLDGTSKLIRFAVQSASSESVNPPGMASPDEPENQAFETSPAKTENRRRERERHFAPAALAESVV